MANIEKVDYNTIPDHAKKIKEFGKGIGRDCKEIYVQIGQMHNAWHGVRYSTLVKDFNRIRPNINELLKLIVGEIPYALYTVANNYALADTGNKAPKTEAMEEPEQIQDLETFDSEKDLRYMSTDVGNVKTEIDTKFKDVNSKLESIKGEMNTVKENFWKSDAANAFDTKFNQLKNNITTAFEDLNSQFSKLMQQTEDDINTAEKSNTVS